jgi:hypothetical protein
MEGETIPSRICQCWRVQAGQPDGSSVFLLGLLIGASVSAWVHQSDALLHTLWHRSFQPLVHVKTGLPHGSSRVELGQVLFIPLDRNKERSSLNDCSGKITQLDPISDRQLFDLIVSQFPLRLPNRRPCVWCYGCLVGILDGSGLSLEWPSD